MAGAVLVVSALVTTASLGVTGVAAATALAESQRLAGVADAAALAGGDAMLGWVSEQPCDAATRVARANGAPLTACSIEGATVVVTVSGAALGLPLQRSARAGAPRT
ncbi:Rv3654c family TadE-like protein [Microcella alkalica]|uniref:Rv3654c family TadE-like protein n=1 Tax=Microcella alkalica TaxID=355930 RepID=UPI00145D10C8|nr:Rv3654c family TadE-like protein [Microcella alkalica]